jgi:hypothetical protein
MKRTTRCAAIAALTLMFTLQALTTAVWAEDNAVATIDRLLEQSGYPYKKNTDIVWHFEFSGKSMPTRKLVGSSDKELMVIFVTLVPKKDFTITPELLEKLLKYNQKLDRVKVSLDSDGDISVRIDLSWRVVDLQEFKVNIDQLKAASIEIYEGVKPFLTTVR